MREKEVSAITISLALHRILHIPPSSLTSNVSICLLLSSLITSFLFNFSQIMHAKKSVDWTTVFIRLCLINDLIEEETEFEVRPSQ